MGSENEQLVSKHALTKVKLNIDTQGKKQGESTLEVCARLEWCYTDQWLESLHFSSKRGQSISPKMGKNSPFFAAHIKTSLLQLGSLQ